MALAYNFEFWMDGGTCTDLELRFNLASSEKDAASCVSIKNMPIDNMDEYMLGIVVASF